MIRDNGALSQAPHMRPENLASTPLCHYAGIDCAGDKEPDCRGHRIELNKPVRLIGLRVAGFLRVAPAAQKADAQNRIAPRAVSRLAG